MANEISRLLSDESFLPNLSIRQQLKLISRLSKAKTQEQIDRLIQRASKLKRK